MHSPYSILLFCCALLCGACQNSETLPSTEAYRNEIETWRNQRLAALKAPDGWPSLAGLFKLREGENTFGAAPDNDLVFPESAPARMGVIHLQTDSIYMQIAESVPVRIKDSLIQEAPLSAEQPVLFEHAALNWYMIERGGQYFIRLRDTLHQARQTLTGIPHFPVDRKWRVQATFIPFDPPKTIPVRNVLDMDIDSECEGKLQFEMEGKTHEIWVLDGGPEEYFLIIADLTTGEETYGGGRYLYVPKPDADGKTIIDFNKAYNPPCVFTKYATCLLPPVQNRLDLAIRAGEKMYGEGH